MSQAPPADAFPAYPASWYLFGASRELRRGPVSKRLLGRRLVAFRTERGRLAVMDGECSHLGADLGGGDVVGETIRCPFHHWRYGCDGVCVARPGEGPQPIPPFARQRSYPVAERHGLLFFFNGDAPLFPLPFFPAEEPADWRAAEPFSYVADCSWYMTSAHAFDRQHLAAVHDRELLSPPVVDEPAPFARRNRYPARVTGDGVFDRVLRTAAGATVETTLTIWGGTFAVITADFARARSRFLMPLEPLEDGRTRCHGIAFAPASLLAPLQLRLRRLFTYKYLAGESDHLRSTRYNPRALGRSDQDLIDFFHWAAALPQEGDHEDSDRSPAPALPDAVAVPRPSAGAARGWRGQRGHLG